MSIFVLGSFVSAHCLYMARLPEQGESLAAEDLRIELGGKGFNVAVGMHRLGGDIQAMLVVGKDAAAETLVRFLSDEGLDTQQVIRVAAHSGLGVGFIAPNGDNCIAVYPGANALMDAAMIKQLADKIVKADLVYAQFEIPDAPIISAFRYAKAQGVQTFLNPSPWRTISLELMQITDILVVNESEALMLFGLKQQGRISPQQWCVDLPDFAANCGWQGGLLVVTLAEWGCVALSAGQVMYSPALAITVVDATGAGDAFNAGLATALVKQKSLESALKFASACGAWVAARAGVLHELPNLTDIEASMSVVNAAKD